MTKSIEATKPLLIWTKTEKDESKDKYGCEIVIENGEEEGGKFSKTTVKPSLGKASSIKGFNLSFSLSLKIESTVTSCCTNLSMESESTRTKLDFSIFDSNF